MRKSMNGVNMLRCQQCGQTFDTPIERRQHAGADCSSPIITPLQLRAQTAESPRLLLSAFAAIAARGMGPVCDNGWWQYDTSHNPPNGRLPLSFCARSDQSVFEPASVSTVHLSEAQQAEHAGPLQLKMLSPLARPVIAFTRMSSGDPVLPPLYDPSRGPQRSAALFWRLFCTDSCEAIHTGVLLALRQLMEHQSQCPVVTDEQGCHLTQIGLHNAERMHPFDR